MLRALKLLALESATAVFWRAHHAICDARCWLTCDRHAADALLRRAERAEQELAARRTVDRMQERRFSS